MSERGKPFVGRVNPKGVTQRSAKPSAGYVALARPTVAAAWPERGIVQHTVAQLRWWQKLALLEKLSYRLFDRLAGQGLLACVDERWRCVGYRKGAK